MREASRLGPEVIERFAATLEPLRLRALAFLARGMSEGEIRRQDPALLEQSGGNEFSARVFPIPARGRKELIVSYSQELTRANEPYRLPLRGLPRVDSLSIRALIGKTKTTTAGGSASSLGGERVQREVIEVNKHGFRPDRDFENAHTGDRGRLGLRDQNLVVARIVPVTTERTVVTLEPSRWRERARRWQRVAKEAAKQCGRAVIPPVDVARPLAEFLALDEPAHLRLCLWPRAAAQGEGGGEAAAAQGQGGGQALPFGTTLTQSLPPTLPVGAHVHLLIGPEGGLSRREVETAEAHGFRVVGVGPRILRSETAGPAILAVLQSRFGGLQ